MRSWLDTLPSAKYDSVVFDAFYSAAYRSDTRAQHKPPSSAVVQRRAQSQVGERVTRKPHKLENVVRLHDLRLLSSDNFQRDSRLRRSLHEITGKVSRRYPVIASNFGSDAATSQVLGANPALLCMEPHHTSGRKQRFGVFVPGLFHSFNKLESCEAPSFGLEIPRSGRATV